MEHCEITHQMTLDCALSRDEIVATLLEDIHATDPAASIRRAARKRRLASDFATERGWQLAKKPFGLGALIRGSTHSWVRIPATGETYHSQPRFFDHPYYFRKARRAVAIASHLYGFDAAAVAEFADANGLGWEIPDFPSWWYPGATTLVVFTKTEGSTGSTRGHFLLEQY